MVNNGNHPPDGNDDENLGTLSGVLSWQLRSQRNIVETAEKMWKFGGEKAGLDLEFWLAAKTYLKTVATVLEQVSKSTEKNAPLILDLNKILWGNAFFDLTHSLAAQMCHDAGAELRKTPAHFWSFAAKHIAAIIIGAIETTENVMDTANALTKRFETFSPEEHLKHIKDSAFFLWRGSGGEYWQHALDDWLQAEREVLGKIEKGENLQQS